jgi:hypothetical protein
MPVCVVVLPLTLHITVWVKAVDALEMVAVAVAPKRRLATDTLDARGMVVSAYDQDCVEADTGELRYHDPEIETVLVPSALWGTVAVHSPKSVQLLVILVSGEMDAEYAVPLKVTLTEPVPYVV